MSKYTDGFVIPIKKDKVEDYKNAPSWRAGFG